MKNSKFTIISFFIIVSGFIFSSASGQNIASIKTADEFWRLQTNGERMSKIILSDKDIEGSPYLNDNFISGNVITKKGVKYIGIPLRYNIYSQNFEFKTPKQILEFRDPASIREVEIKNEKFIFVPFKKKNKKLDWGFFQKINKSGPAQLLIRYRVTFSNATKPGAYSDAKPAGFSDKEKLFFVKFGTHPAVRIFRSSDFIDNAPKHKTEIKKFIKSNKIKVRRQKDLLKLVNYYNSLQ